MVPIIKKNFGEDTSGFEERAAKRASQKSTKSMTNLVGDYKLLNNLNLSNSFSNIHIPDQKYFNKGKCI
jgi:hypothetical protein